MNVKIRNFLTIILKFPSIPPTYSLASNPAVPPFFAYSKNAVRLFLPASEKKLGRLGTRLLIPQLHSKLSSKVTDRTVL